ncbi:MAG: carboxypeptidase regulatory-like domain-containing protein [Candidatus Moranbacteria bacterium]|nr:carboxypeptidase regulatory-like domain-containing protein [Candidatus Moranbacteria bacterium]
MARNIIISRLNDRKRGFTLVEAMFFLFLFSVIALTFYQLFAVGSKRILDVRRKLGATALASERMETVRSLPYASIGTKRPDGAGGWDYGIPAGDILETESIVKTGATYTVHTVAQYEDDSFDGTASGGTHDSIPTDYKQVRIEVTWVGAEGGQEVVTWGTFSPEGVEQPSNTGVLSINVTDPSGASLQNADVHIVSATGNVDLTAQTDVYGNLSFPGAPPASDYMLYVSKNGYYGVQTYPAAPASAFNPLDLPMSVVIGSVNQKSFAIGRSSGITVRSEDAFGTAIPSVAFTLSGGHQVGTKLNTIPVEPVYDFSVSDTTGSDGQKAYADRSYGRYALAASGSVTGYRFLRVDPGILNTPDTFDMVVGTDLIAKMVFAETSVGSVLVSVKTNNGSADVPVQNASVRLQDGTIGYDATVTTGPSGQAYFPTSMPALQAGTYQYDVTADGYAAETGSIAVTGMSLQDQSVTLTEE